MLKHFLCMTLTVTAKDCELGFKSSHPGLSLCSYPHHKQRYPVTAAATKAVKDAGDTYVACFSLQVGQVPQDVVKPSLPGKGHSCQCGAAWS